MQSEKGRARTLFLVQSALFAAVICIFAPLAVPIGPVPVTLGAFAVMLAGVVLDWRRAAAAVAVYILLGLVGLPVFSGGKGGFAVLAGPTGGYIWAYLPMAMLIAALGGGARERAWSEDWRAFAACLLSMLALYLLGTLQFTIVADCGWGYALGVCVYPFVAVDVAKAVCATLLGVRVRRRLRAAGLL